MICCNTDPKFRYFEYKGNYYGTGTKLVWTDDFITKMSCRGINIWKYAEFKCRVNNNGINTYAFHPYQIDWSLWYKNNYTGYYALTYEDIMNGVENIIEPNIVAPPLVQKKYDWDCPELMVGWIVYIITMIGCLIFKDVALFWAFVSIVFFAWRKGKLEE